MTVGTQIQQALGMLKTASGNFQTFALETDDPNAKQMYTNFCKQIDQMVGELSTRVQYMENQEPQYKMESMAQQGSQDMGSE